MEWSLNIKDTEKIDCYPDEHGISEAACIARGCVWAVSVLMLLVLTEIFCSLSTTS